MMTHPNPSTPDFFAVGELPIVSLSESAQRQFAILAPTYAPSHFAVVATEFNGVKAIRPISITDKGRGRWLSTEVFRVFPDEVIPASATTNC